MSGLIVLPLGKHEAKKPQRDKRKTPLVAGSYADIRSG